MIEMDNELNILIHEFKHVFLIRDPAEMLISLDKSLPNPTLRDTAYEHQLELFEKVKSSGLPLYVIDSRELLKHPEFVLSSLSNRLDIIFDEAMLSWEAGAIPEDGIWGKYWYENLHQSTGFKPYHPKKNDFPARLQPLYEKCKPIYDKLFAHAIKF